MRKNKIFIAIDTTNILKAKKIISHSNNTKLNIGYKFGIEFLNSQKGRKFVSQLKNKISRYPGNLRNEPEPFGGGNSHLRLQRFPLHRNVE